MTSSKFGRIIERSCCRQFGIGIPELYDGKRKDRTFTDCLHFVWYFRNRMEGFSLTSLSRAYGRTRRNISAAIAKITSGTKTQEYYISRKKAIMEDMIRGIFEESSERSPTDRKRKER